jgi:UDP-glucose 4-epimerase
MLNGRQPTIFGDGLQSRDFTFVSNIVDANMLAAEAPAEDVSGKVFNIANGMSINLLMLVDTINEILGTHIKPIHAAPRVGDIRESVADISQARQYLKFEPRVGLLEGLTKTVEFYRESPL